MRKGSERERERERQYRTDERKQIERWKEELEREQCQCTYKWVCKGK